MTKKFEEYRWFSLADIPLDFMPQLGEFAVILVPGNKIVAEDWEKEIALRVASDKEWAKEISKRFGMTSSEIYNALQKIKSK